MLNNCKNLLSGGGNMNPQDFLDVARTLSKNNNEAFIRSLIGRSYYAMIIHIKEALSDELHIPFSKGDNIHELIPRYLNNSQVLGTQNLAQEISDFRDKRNEADYNMKIKFTEIDKLWIITAEKIIAKFDNLNKPKLQAGILSYLRGLGYVR
jgi:hypothetical protein